MSHRVHSWRTYELPVTGEVREGEYEHGEPNQPGYCMPMDVTTLSWSNLYQSGLPHQIVDQCEVQTLWRNLRSQLNVMEQQESLHV